MPSEIVRAEQSSVELLSDALRREQDPTARVALGQQIVDLLTKQEELRQSRERFDWEKQEREARVAFAQAFEKFKIDAPKILKTKHVNYPSKDSTKPNTSYWHVELDKACDILIPALLKVGITHRWKSADLPGGGTRVTCFLRHRLGHEEEGASLAGPADQSGGKNPIQGVGSSTSYLERYTFLASLGIVPTGKDDDGVAPGISNEQGDELVAAIQAAENAKDAMGAWTTAINAAKKLEPIDYRAMTIFTEARDAKLKELRSAK